MDRIHNFKIFTLVLSVAPKISLHVVTVNLTH